jgi:hypothetical protein
VTFKRYIMETDAEDYGWEEIYHLYGVCTELHDAQPSLGEVRSCPTPPTDFSGMKRWF